MALTKVASEMVAYDQGGTGATARDIGARLKDSVSVFDYMTTAQITDITSDAGIVDCKAAILAAFTANSNIYFPDGTYLIESNITTLRNNFKVDFGNAIIRHGSQGGTLFYFGIRSNTPIYTGLLISGGNFEQKTPTTTNDANYIRVLGTKGFSIRDCYMKNGSNGAILIEAGCEDGVIDNVTLDGASNSGVERGIYLGGDTATDYAGVLVDITSITRNATAVPTYAVKNVKIINCTIAGPEYGIYMINTRDCSVINCYIDISVATSPKRCIAVNNYSPGAKIIGNTLKSNASSTGVLVTQVSTNVLIKDNVFQGTFGGNRDIHVEFLSKAIIQGNRFNTEGITQIEIDMGGSAIIQNNEFIHEIYAQSHRAIYIIPISAALANTSTYGDTATILEGSIITNNVFRNGSIACLFDADSYPSANTTNKPAINQLIFKDNLIFNMDSATQVGEYPLVLVTGTGGKLTRYIYSGNHVFPYTDTDRNTVVATGTDHTQDYLQVMMCSFQVDITSGHTATVTQQTGANFSLAASRSSSDITLTPRTRAGSGVQGVPWIVAITDRDGNAYTYEIYKSSNTYILKLYDSAGSQLGAVDVNFNVLLLSTDGAS